MPRQLRTIRRACRADSACWNGSVVGRQAIECRRVQCFSPEKFSRDAFDLVTAIGEDLFGRHGRLSLGFKSHCQFACSIAACADPLRIDLTLGDGELNGRATVEMLYRDNGPGLNDEQRAKVFEPFYTTKTKGTGLGMAIAKRIIEAHGGQISVSSNGTPGAGFAITLPRQTA